jgi:hypothetical protein
MDTSFRASPPVSGLMQTDFHTLPSYDDAVNPENADRFTVLNHVPVSLSSDHATAAPRSAAVWQFQSLGGAFKDFSVEVSHMLESAQVSGLSTYEIPERNWFFDFTKMTQTNFLVIKRHASVLPAAPTSAPH